MDKMVRPPLETQVEALVLIVWAMMWVNMGEERVTAACQLLV
jgi:hypothetical protein